MLKQINPFVIQGVVGADCETMEAKVCRLCVPSPIFIDEIKKLLKLMGYESCVVECHKCKKTT